MEEENISITNFLKQRYPMLLVDKVVDYNDKSTKTIKYFTNSDPFMLGHFKDFPMYPTVLLVELLAQSISFSIYKKLGTLDNIWFLSINRCHYYGYFVPGDVAKVTVTIQSIDETGIIQCSGFIKNQHDTKIVECKFNLIRKKIH